jgi:Family of unknown function (DUF6174)
MRLMDSRNQGHAEVGVDVAPRKRRRSRTLVTAAGILVGVAIGLGLVFAALIWNRKASAPIVTREDLAAAERRWNDRGPASYNMDLEIGGRQPGPVHIEVRDGRVTRMTRNGVTPSQPRTWAYWTVPEQFETIRQDFDSAETPGGFGAAVGTQTILKAEFDPEFGYPRRYQRFVLASKAPSQSPTPSPQVTSGGADLDVEWIVTRFAAIP